MVAGSIVFLLLDIKLDTLNKKTWIKSQGRVSVRIVSQSPKLESL